MKNTDMQLYNNLPLYEALISDVNEGVYCVSLVTNPATDVNFVAFDEDKPIMKFAVDNKVERMVSGIIMLADAPLYRRTADNFEYYIVYSKETLKVMAEKMIFDGVGSQVNIQHRDGSNVDGVNLVELYCIDREKGIAPEYFKDVPDGSLVGTYKVHSDEVWDMIENGDVLSFSLEGVFSIEETFGKQEQINNNTNKEKKLMSKLSKIKEVLKSLLVEFGSVSTSKGVIFWDTDEELKEGDSVYGMNDENERVALEDGDYETEDGKTVVVVDGKVAEIKDNEAEVAPEEESETEEQENAEDEPASEDEPATEEEPVVDEKDAEIERLRARIAELEAENEELKARIADLEQMPAAESAEETFEKVEKQVETKADKMRKRGYVFNS